MWWVYDCGCHEGGSEGTGSSATRSCSSGAPMPFEGGEGVVRREELPGEVGKRCWCLRSRFIYIYKTGPDAPPHLSHLSEKLLAQHDPLAILERHRRP